MVWQLRTAIEYEREPTQAWEVQVGDLPLSGLHAHLWAEALERRVHRQAEDDSQAAADQTPRGQADAPNAALLANLRARPVGRVGGARVFVSVRRSARQWLAGAFSAAEVVNEPAVRGVDFEEPR